MPNNFMIHAGLSQAMANLLRYVADHPGATGGAIRTAVARTNGSRPMAAYGLLRRAITIHAVVATDVVEDGAPRPRLRMHSISPQGRALLASATDAADPNPQPTPQPDTTVQSPIAAQRALTNGSITTPYRPAADRTAMRPGAMEYAHIPSLINGTRVWPTPPEYLGGPHD